MSTHRLSDLLDTAKLDAAAARLLDPASSTESYEDFLAQFSCAPRRPTSVAAAAAAAATAEEEARLAQLVEERAVEAAVEALLLQEGGRGGAAETANEGDGDNNDDGCGGGGGGDDDDGTCTTVSIGEGAAVSILDAGAAVQGAVRFDNFVSGDSDSDDDDDDDDDDGGGGGGARSVASESPSSSSPSSPAAAAAPTNAAAASAAAAAVSALSSAPVTFPDDVSDLSSSQYEWEHVAGPREPAAAAAAGASSPAAAAAVSGAACGAAPAAVPAAESPRVALGPELPPPPPPQPAEQSAERPREAELRRWQGRVQACGLPPGWSVDAATMRSLPPHDDVVPPQPVPPSQAAAAATTAAGPSADEGFSREEVQRLHHALLADPNTETDEPPPLTDADVFVREEVRRVVREGSGGGTGGTGVAEAPEPVRRALLAADRDLFESLHAPAEPSSADAAHEAAFVQAAAAAEAEDEDGGGAAEVAGCEEAAVEAGYTRVGERWTERLAPFALDPHFDYDNVDPATLTKKPMSPYEV